MINNIFPHRYDNSFKSIKPTIDDYLLCFKDNNVLLRRTFNHLEIPKFEGVIKARYIFSIDEKKYFLVEYEDLYHIDESYEFVNVSTIRTMEPQVDAYAIICGKHYAFSFNRGRYCGICGSRMVPSEAETANVCPECRNIKYPEIMPAVAVAITNDDEILLTKYQGRQNGYYALVAGYLEIGETLEECVKREVMEEVGITIKDIKYYDSQPWGFSNTIMIGFTASAVTTKITKDDNELSVAEWVNRKDIEPMENPTSMSHSMIQDFRNNKF